LQSNISGEIHITGNTVIDSLLSIANRKNEVKIPGYQFNQRKLILATIHRRENWGTKMEEICNAFKKIINNNPDSELLIPLHKNPIVRDKIKNILGKNERIFLTEPLGYYELVNVMKNCHFIITDSGGIQEEAPSLGKPLLILRETTERPEVIQSGSAKLIGTKINNIYYEASKLLSNVEAYKAMSKPNNPFGDGFASSRIYEACVNFIKKKSGNHS